MAQPHPQPMILPRSLVPNTNEDDITHLKACCAVISIHRDGFKCIVLSLDVYVHVDGNVTRLKQWDVYVQAIGAASR